MGPVMQSIGPERAPYVMGDDPERMDADAVVAAQPLRRAVIRTTEPVAGYLYVVCHPGDKAASRWAAARTTLGQPALILIAAIVALTTLIAAWVTASITRPLARLTRAVKSVSRDGLKSGDADVALPPISRDEFGQLTGVFRDMLATLRTQWATLHRLDHFRREAVSNLSHDLRSPLTATVACLETLDTRLAAAAVDRTAAQEPRRLIEIALRNTRNAARLVQSLGELAKLDEPEFKLQPVAVDACELIDDIVLRFAERARLAQVGLAAVHAGAVPAWLDIELFERALANLLDNALKFARPGDRIEIRAELRDGQLQVTVADTGPGIAAADLPHLFDRFYQSRHGVAPATGEGGKGLGLAIVKRIAELHGGQVSVRSEAGQGADRHAAICAAAREPVTAARRETPSAGSAPQAYSRATRKARGRQAAHRGGGSRRQPGHARRSVRPVPLDCKAGGCRPTSPITIKPSEGRLLDRRPLLFAPDTRNTPDLHHAQFARLARLAPFARFVTSAPFAFSRCVAQPQTFWAPRGVAVPRLLRVVHRLLAAERERPAERAQQLVRVDRLGDEVVHPRL